MSQLVGGPSGVKEADAEIQDILDKVGWYFFTIREKWRGEGRV